jgi:hypothetical protein
MCLLLSAWGLSIVASLPSAALAADPSNDDGDSANGPILVAPQNDRPPVAEADEPTGSSRRQWLGLRRPLALDPARNLQTAQKLAYDTTLINDYDNTLIHHFDQPDDQPDDLAESASRAARAAAWCGQRLKRALIEAHSAAITYSCEQAEEHAGPKLLPPQQAKPLTALADDSVDNLQLDPDEPAKVILDIREQVGPKLFEGTIFEDAGWRARASAETSPADHRAQLVRCIRDMAENREAENREPCAAHCEFDSCAGATGCPAACVTVAPPADAEPSPPIRALRQTSRQLDKLAESLEEQKLYDQADELREMAQQMRMMVRASESESPTSIERSARK